MSGGAGASNELTFPKGFLWGAAFFLPLLHRIEPPLLMRFAQRLLFGFSPAQVDLDIDRLAQTTTPAKGSDAIAQGGKPLLANDPHLAPTAPGIWYLTHLSAPGIRVSGAYFPPKRPNRPKASGSGPAGGGAFGPPG